MVPLPVDLQRDIKALNSNNEDQQEYDKEQVVEPDGPSETTVEEQPKNHRQQVKSRGISPEAKWIDSQEGVNQLVELLQQRQQEQNRQRISSDHGSSQDRSLDDHTSKDGNHSSESLRRPLQVTVIQTSSQIVTAHSQSPTLRCLGLFRAIRFHESIHTLNLIGLGPCLETDQMSQQALMQAIQTAPNLKRFVITHVSLSAQPPARRPPVTEDDSFSSSSSFATKLCLALTHCPALEDLRLSFCEDPAAVLEEEDGDDEDEDDPSVVSSHTANASIRAQRKFILRTLAQCRHLKRFELFGFRFRDDAILSRRSQNNDTTPTTPAAERDVSLLEKLIRNGSPNLRELRLVRCHLSSHVVRRLCQVIQETNRPWNKIDFSMNQIEWWDAVTPLLLVNDNNNDNNDDGFGLTELCLSHNDLCDNDTASHEQTSFCRALRQNTTLKRLNLDLNPLSQSFGQALLETLQQHNTSLVRVSIVVRTKSLADLYDPLGVEQQRRRRQGLEQAQQLRQHHQQQQPEQQKITKACVEQIRFAVALNEAGRQWLRQSDDTIPALPRLLARVRHNSSLVYGLLKECRPVFSSSH